MCPLGAVTNDTAARARAPEIVVTNRAQDQPATSKLARTLAGRTRTTSSPGTALRWPNSSARPAPMYRAAIAVAVRSSSAGSSDSSASPWTWTNAYGGSSRSTHRLIRGSRASARPFAVSLPVLNTRLPSSTMNHTGATSGRPLAARKPSLPVRVPWLRKSLTAGSPSEDTSAADHVAQAELPALPPQRRRHHPVPPRRADGRPVAGFPQHLGAGQLVQGQEVGPGPVEPADQPVPPDPPPAGHLEQHRDVLLGVPGGQVRLALGGHRQRYRQDHRRRAAHRRSILADLLEDPPLQGAERGHHAFVAVAGLPGQRLVPRSVDDLGAVEIVKGEPGRLLLVERPVPKDPAEPGHGQPGRPVLVVVPVVELRLVDGSRFRVHVEEACRHETIVCEALSGPAYDR